MVVAARILFFVMIVLIAAVLGAAAAFFGMIAIGTVAGTDNTGGGLAMGAAGFAPVGAIVGAAIGTWFAWRTIFRFGDNAVMASGFGLAVLAVGAWFVNEELTDGDPYEPGREPTVLIEWRVPEAIPPDEVDGIYRFTMRSSYMNWTLSTRWDEPRARADEEHTILRMRGEIRWRVNGRVFQLWRAPAHDDRITVDLGLARDPQPSAEYGPWREVDGAPGHAFRTRVVAQ
ncbi:hypothetical protein [Nitratireductor mangrovi]|nr:hypothetical protein [Nitratireductor mangrovi]